MLVKKGELKVHGNDLSKLLDTCRKLADDVEDAISGGDDSQVDSSDPKLVERMRQLREAMNNVDREWQGLLAVAGGASSENEIAVSEGERLSFDGFLTQVGKAMLATQRHLDKESLAYLRETAGASHLLPSIFRLPKLSADMKFALETQKGSEANLVFFKKQTLARELHQQSIHFELVSTPPPPDFLKSVQAAVPNMSLLLDKAERAKVLQVAASAKPADRLPPDADTNRIIILGAQPQQGHIVLYAASKGKNSVGVWLESGGVFRSIYAFEDAIDSAERFLRTFVSELADSQKRFLSES